MSNHIRKFPLLTLLVAGVGWTASLLGAAELRSGYYQGREVRYEVIDGLAYVEGDIILGTAEQMEAETRRHLAGPPISKQAVATSIPARYWPGGVVPYSFSDDLPATSRQVVADAVAFYAARTSLRWVARTSEANYVTFRRANPGSPCGSVVGMLGGQQFINFPDGCPLIAMVHEMGHTLGLFHEQSRGDRNRHLTVLFENILKPARGQFAPSGAVARDVGFYDYGSTMQYSIQSFSVSNAPVMQSVPVGIPLGTSPNVLLSEGDLDSLSRLYSGNIGTVITSHPLGLSIIVDGAAQTTPINVNWAPGSTHTIEAPAPQTLAGQDGRRYQFAKWSDGGAQVHTVTASDAVGVYSAAFVLQLQVSGGPLTAGQGTVSSEPASADGLYPSGSTVRFRATPTTGFNFLGWDSPAGQSCPLGANTGEGRASLVRTVVLVSNPVTCRAIFTNLPIVTITSDPPGRQLIVDNNAFAAPGNFTWAAGTNHTIAAADNLPPSSLEQVRYLFSGWSDGGNATHAVSANPGATITARFRPQYQLSIAAPPAPVGVVSLDPPSRDGFYDPGTHVDARFTPAAGTDFVLISWTEDAAGRQNPVPVVMNEGKLVGVAFGRPQAPPLTIVNAATFERGPVAPGELVTIFGQDIGPPQLAGLELDSLGRAATTIGETRVLFNGVAAPMVYASSGQTAAIVPYSIAGRPNTAIQVSYQGQLSPEVGENVSPTRPGLFTANSSGTGPAALLNQDGSANSESNPAPAGSIVSLFATGEGQTDPPGIDGLLAGVPLPSPVAPVAVRIGGLPAEVLYAGGAPGLVAGVMQVNVRIPAGLLPGAQPLLLIVGNAASRHSVTIAVR